jgi:hypothetical protein
MPASNNERRYMVTRNCEICGAEFQQIFEHQDMLCDKHVIEKLNERIMRNKRARLEGGG